MKNKLSDYKKLYIIELINELYKFSECGHFLHIVTDDGNLDLSSLRFCEKKIREYEKTVDWFGKDKNKIFLQKEILKELKSVSFSDREHIYNEFWEKK